LLELFFESIKYYFVGLPTRIKMWCFRVNIHEFLLEKQRSPFFMDSVSQNFNLCDMFSRLLCFGLLKLQLVDLISRKGMLILWASMIFVYPIIWAPLSHQLLTFKALLLITIIICVPLLGCHNLHSVFTILALQ
jgi:hypothetical protein